MQDAADAQLIIGGSRALLAHVRLGLPEDADAETMRERVEDEARALAEARRIAADRARRGRRLPGGDPQPGRGRFGGRRPPAPSPSAPESDVAPADDTLVAAADVVLPGGPGDGLGHGAAEEGEEHKSRLRRKKKDKRLSAFADRHPFH